MQDSRLKDLISEAKQLNVSYCNAYVDITRSYLEAVGALFTGSLKDTLGGRKDYSQSKQPADSAPTSTASPNTPSAPLQPPLLLAATKGSLAEALFTIVNHLTRDVTADISLSKSLREAGVTASPIGKQFAAGESAVCSLCIKIPASLEINRDVHGTVSVPTLSSRDIDVVVRRLADLPRTKKKSSTKPRKARAKR